MIDAHTHLEKGPLTIDYVMRFVKQAKAKGIDTLHILDHSHRFVEFKPIYEKYRDFEVQDKWLEPKFQNHLQDSINLKNEFQKLDVGIDVKFGLEICYQKDQNETIINILKDYNFDFLIGSVHAVDYRIYDCSFSKELLFDQYDVDDIYRKYYEEQFALIESDIFTQIGHPDQIKICGKYPSYYLTETYEKFAKLANEHHIIVENNTGSHYRYNHEDLGINKQFLDILKKNSCEMVTSSDTLP